RARAHRRALLPPRRARPRGRRGEPPRGKGARPGRPQRLRERARALRRRRRRGSAPGARALRLLERLGPGLGPRGGAVAGARARLVVIGASNASMALPRVLRTLEPPLELLVAAGHGRSYGSWSRYFARELPPILEC